MSEPANLLRPRGLTQGVAAAALAGPEELARRQGAAALVRLGSNESPYGPSPGALTALHAEAGRSHRYGDPSERILRDAIARHHAIDVRNVTVGAGIDDLLGWIVRAYLAPGEPAIAGLGSFPTFEMHANGYEADLQRVPYRADGRLDLDGLLRAAGPRGGLIFFPNPDNPSGSVYPWRDVVAFLDALPPKTLVIHDEAYANFLPPPLRFPPDAVDPRMIRLRTFSKEYGLAGLRVGYAIADATAIEALDALRLLYGVSRPAQAAAVAALEDRVHVATVVARTAEGRAEYAALGRRLGIAVLPSVTNFVLFDLGSAPRAVAAQRALLEAGIHVRKPPEPPLDRCIRVSVGAPAGRAAFAAALERFVAAG